jgi:hypothetical protein
MSFELSFWSASTGTVPSYTCLILLEKKSGRIQIPLTYRMIIGIILGTLSVSNTRSVAALVSPGHTLLSPFTKLAELG